MNIREVKIQQKIPILDKIGVPNILSMTANCFVEFSGSDFQASCDQTKLIFERGQNSEMSEYHLRSLLKQEGTDLSGDIQFGHVGDESLSNAGVPKTVHLIISGQNDPRCGLETYLISLIDSKFCN